MPANNTNGRRKRRTKRRWTGGIAFQNTVQEQVGESEVFKDYTLSDLLGTSITDRKVKLCSILVQFLPNQLSSAQNDVAAQLQLGGTIWTGQSFAAGGNLVPNAKYKMLNRVKPSTLFIVPFQPTMRVALDSEDIEHGLRVQFNGTAEGVFLVITTSVQLLPQQNLVTITKGSRPVADREVQGQDF
jgi:hypothetical protein